MNVWGIYIEVFWILKNYFDVCKSLVFFHSSLELVENVMMTRRDTKASNISWLSYHAKNQNDEKVVDISVLLLLFREGWKSAAMIMHTMGVVKQAVNHVNPNQTPVIALDQLLYAIARKSLWSWWEPFTSKWQL